MTTAAQYTCFVNPEASAGSTLQRLRAALSRNPRLMGRCHIVIVRSRQELRVVIRAMPGSSVPVAVGGDGTVNWLAAALRDRGMQDRPLAVLPLGTGNAFAHSLGLGSIEAALEALESGVERRIDVMMTTHRASPVALVSISVGFESRFLGAAASSRRWRRIVSGARGLHAAMSRPWARSSLTVDGEPLVRPTERVYNSGLYCMPCYALGRVVLPEADPADGRAEAVVYRSPSAYWRTLWQGVRFVEREVPSDLSIRRWESARLEADEPIQIDGESVAGGRFEVRVEPKALKVIVPRTVQRGATRR